MQKQGLSAAFSFCAHALTAAWPTSDLLLCVCCCPMLRLKTEWPGCSISPIVSLPPTSLACETVLGGICHVL